jgi:hypothetical protein
MTKKTTRSNEYSESQGVLFLAFELGASKWDLGFSTGFGQKPRRRQIEARDLETLQTEIAGARKRFGLAEDTPLRSCYEAGRDGFWLHRHLTAVGSGYGVAYLQTHPLPHPHGSELRGRGRAALHGQTPAPDP